MNIICGAKISIFWITAFIWDCLSYFITVCFMILTLKIFEKFGWSTPNEINQLFIILILFGLTVIPKNYMIVSFFDDPSSGFGILSIINFIFGTPIFLLVSKFDSLKKWDNVLFLYPHYALSRWLTNWNNNCNSDDFAYMALTGVISLALLIIIESSPQSCNIINKFTRKLPLEINDEYLDYDVINEKQKINSMPFEVMSSYNLVINRLTKFFGNFLAVKQLSITISPGECLGLIGMNGAGKTTTFKMLTGDVQISDGNGWIGGYNLNKNISKILKTVGYCPQYDALIGDYTGEETLKMYSLLRGIPRNEINQTIHKLSTQLGFSEYLNKKVSSYSGGNKRKLSIAIALIGNPYLLYFDEPTTGMDPKAKQNFWNILCKIRNAGTSIILTSHCMDECEAVCNRLAIMVSGELKCLGSLQYLKNKFAKKFILTIKIKNLSQ